MALSSLQNILNTWESQLPQNLKEQAFSAFVGGTAAVTLLTAGDIGQAVLTGSLSCLATTIYGVSSPVFRYLMDGKTSVNRGGELLRGAIVLLGTASLAAFLGLRGVSRALLFNIAIHGVRTLLSQISPNLTSSTPIPFLPPGVLPPYFLSPR